MFFISHRGNISGPNKEYENKPEYIKKALTMGFDCEIDAWFLNEQWFLGHDYPQYKIKQYFLLEDGLWIHAKNLSALSKLTALDVNYFWHQGDSYTLTSKKYIWTYPGFELSKKSICVMPETVPDFAITDCAGICSDFIEDYK